MWGVSTFLWLSTSLWRLRRHRGRGRDMWRVICCSSEPYTGSDGPLSPITVVITWICPNVMRLENEKANRTFGRHHYPLNLSARDFLNRQLLVFACQQRTQWSLKANLRVNDCARQMALCVCVYNFMSTNKYLLSSCSVPSWARRQGESGEQN